MKESPFTILGLPAVFGLDAATIERAFLERSALVHPDLAGNGTDAAEKAAALNDARATVADPESRARVLLAKSGGVAAGQERELPDGFLTEMLEKREEIEAAVEGGDAAEIAEHRAWARAERGRYVERVGGLFAQTPADGREINRQLNAWRYIERLLEQMAGGSVM